MNDTFLKACRGEATDYTPVWMMRQAGRYLPEYHSVRSRFTFLEMCKTPEAAAEVTIQPVDLIGVDAAILFSDILVVPEAMGSPLEFHENRGPIFPQPVRDEAAVNKLIVPDPEDKLGYVMAAIRLLRKELANKVPLIGFAGAPFTIATYLIEGGSSKNFFLTKKMMYTEPALYARLLDKITASTISYLKAQVEAGAQALQLFDSWAGVLAPRDFAEFAHPYAKRIITALKESGVTVPLIYFANNGATLLDQSKTVGADVLGLDWRINLDEAARIVGPGIALQGNLDPCALLLPQDKLEQRVAAILEQGKAASGHIFNLGHGILPEIPPAQAKLMVETVHRLSAKG
ncbi:MAG TPA: uroporphyrinogen decarboxylase [Desulfurivibrio alkaliphilus]|uniref:Uroporphyrinogen decarboxylase n=1 Tax=Desulfurivibrio alkaliphilus TaxID=427923 RepID=A0A7C2TIE3_9BACT|nr:uroporphyrinogen decarboxylase [Desulfurivibrio alkaliphilus]